MPAEKKITNTVDIEVDTPTTHSEYHSSTTVTTSVDPVEEAKRVLEEKNKGPLPCAFCDKMLTPEERKKCSACGNVFYCSKKCQKDHWKVHKAPCRRDVDLSDAWDRIHVEHKERFDAINKKYNLAAKADDIADYLTNGESDKIDGDEFAERYGMSNAEAKAYLGWIKIGVEFREETLENAKNMGIENPTK